MAGPPPIKPSKARERIVGLSFEMGAMIPSPFGDVLDNEADH